MKQRGVTHMEVVFTAIAVFAAGVLLINRFIFEPEKQAEITTEDRMKIQINALENKIKVMTDIESRFQSLESQVTSMKDTLDHVQNVSENTENFVKADNLQLNNLVKRVENLTIARDQINSSLKKLKDIESPRHDDSPSRRI